MLSRKRMGALMGKEFTQIGRDSSTFLIGIILPLLLIILIGSGLSLDVKQLPIAIVLEDDSPLARDAVSFVNESDYFEPHYVPSMAAAEQLMDRRTIEAIVRVPADFATQVGRGHAEVQAILYGANATTAASARSYLSAGLASWQADYSARHAGAATGTRGGVTVVTRQWFNDANTSTYLFIPGLIVIVLTLVGVFLTALVMAREWERGTLESLFVTPAQSLEIIIAKIIPYSCIAGIGFTLCVLTAIYGYDVPLLGSIPVLALASGIYIIVAVCMGLTISAVVRSQFLACQMALFIGLLPTVMLSGFIFDLHSVPAVVNIIGHVMPATYYMELIKTLFLAGDNPYLAVRNTCVLAGYAVVFLLLSLRLTRKKLD